jgi:hypothetical protein
MLEEKEKEGEEKGEGGSDDTSNRKQKKTQFASYEGVKLFLDGPLLPVRKGETLNYQQLLKFFNEWLEERSEKPVQARTFYGWLGVITRNFPELMVRQTRQQIQPPVTSQKRTREKRDENNNGSNDNDDMEEEDDDNEQEKKRRRIQGKGKSNSQPLSFSTSSSSHSPMPVTKNFASKSKFNSGSKFSSKSKSLARSGPTSTTKSAPTPVKKQKDHSSNWEKENGRQRLSSDFEGLGGQERQSCGRFKF